MRYMWKKLPFSGIIKSQTLRNNSLFVVTQTKSVETVLGNISTEHFADVVIEHNISDVLIAVSPACVPNDDYKKLIENAVNVHISIEAMVGAQTEDQFVSDVGTYKTLSVSAFTFRPQQLMYLVIKRALDFLCGQLMLILLIPVTAFVKCSYLIPGGKGRIFYPQNRAGQNGKTIKIGKYRTMVQNADALLQELLQSESYRLEREQNHKLVHDPRVTKVGAIIRSISDDELLHGTGVLRCKAFFDAP